MTSFRADPVWRDRLIIGSAYTLAWGALLVNRGLYWDDWTSVGLSPAEVVRGSFELGAPWSAILYVPLLSSPLPGLVGHILAFLAYLGSTLLLHAILRRIPGLSRMDALVATLTFALLPVNFARIALVDLMYALSLLAFLAATWLLLRSLDEGGRLRRIGSLGLYLFSFYTASLLVFFVVPLALAFWVARKSRMVSAGSFARRHLDFLILPIAYWTLKTTLFTPTGIYTGYNALTLNGLVRVPKAMVSVPAQVLVEPLVRAVSVAGLFGLVAGVAVAVWLVRRRLAVPDGADVAAPLLAVIGVALIGLGVFAYLAVDRIPTIWDWSSRHQLLVPIGAGLLAAAAARGVPRAGPVGRTAGVVVVGLLLGISVVADARTLVAYQLDWFKQQAIIARVRTIPEMTTARHIRITDTATSYDALRRTYRFYEYNALFSVALGNTRRLSSIGDGEPSPKDLALFISRPAYHMGEYVPSPVDLDLRISAGPKPSALELLRLLALEAVGSPLFDPEVSRLINITATPIVAGPAP